MFKFHNLLSVVSLLEIYSSETKALVEMKMFFRRLYCSFFGVAKKKKKFPKFENK